MRLDQRMQGLQCLGDGTELAGQCRKTELHTFSGITLGLPVQRLMLTVLLEGNHRQQARPRPTSRRRMERRRWLADLLTLPAGELLPDRLNHLPLPRDHLESLGDVLTHLHDLGCPGLQKLRFEDPAWQARPSPRCGCRRG